MASINIGTRILGDYAAPYIIAEAGVNHNNDLKQAIHLVDVAADAGADAIKFQTYRAEDLVVRDAPRFWSWEGEEKRDGNQFDSYSRLDKLPWSDYSKISDHCERRGIEFLSTPFSIDALEMLDDLGMKAVKIASCDITNVPLLEAAAKTTKPILLSTGGAYLWEIGRTLEFLRSLDCTQVCIMHCTLTYPTPPEDANLNAIAALRYAYPQYPIGISDHTLGTYVPIAATALGVACVEKHFTTDKTLPLSADHWLSVDGPELKQIVEGCRYVQKALGKGNKEPLESELIARRNARRSVVSARKISAGEVITADALNVKRPGTGISPYDIDKIIGRRATVDIQEDTLIQWPDVS